MWDLITQLPHFTGSLRKSESMDIVLTYWIEHIGQIGEFDWLIYTKKNPLMVLRSMCKFCQHISVVANNNGMDLSMCTIHFSSYVTKKNIQQ